MPSESRICIDGEGGFVLPFDGENDLPDGWRATIYCLAMAYMFVGVSIIADTFMGAIEVITSRRRQVQLSTGRVITVRVWNDTVANLTLMALGSSAPEILLSVTELLKRKMYSGELGPSTIVGSASFNLLVIIGVCIMVIPSTETRRIRELEVFAITLIFMLLAYLWLVLAVSVISPGIISIPEAIITLVALLPLVYVSFLADIGKLGNFGCHRHRQVKVKAPEIARVCELLGSFDRDTKEAARMGLALNPSKKKHLDNPTSADMEDLRRMIKKYIVTKRSRAARRIEATRALTGSKRISWSFAPTDAMRDRVSGVTGFSHNEVPVVEAKGKGAVLVQFACEHQCMWQEMTEKPITLVRLGDVSKAVKAVIGVMLPADFRSRQTGYITNSGPLEATSSTTTSSGAASNWAGAGRATNVADIMDRVKCTEQVVFEHGEDKKVVTVKRPDGAKGSFIVELLDVRIIEEGDEQRTSVMNERPSDRLKDRLSFRIQSSVMSYGGSTGLSGSEELAEGSMATGSFVPKSKRQAGLGPISRTIITNSKNQGHGKLGFAYERLLIVGATEQQTMEVVVVRSDGCRGKVSCNYRTERLTAVPGYDYLESDGTLEFDEGVTEQFIQVEILPKGGNESKDDFLTVLEDPEGGVEFNPNNDGGAESEILTVSIGPCNLVHAGVRQKLARWLDDTLNFDEVRLGTTEWSEQFKNAIYCNGSPEEQKEASIGDWFFHVMALPWKLAFTLVPPTTYCSGWVCFWCSLFFIGTLTAFIGDLAELFGCVIGLPNIVTAITFVALGTSMPDLFASKTAAMQDPFADASIVNVTGSNSVNVFLGLGLPWTMGAIYWQVSDWDPQWEITYPDVAASHKDSGVMVFVVESDDLGFSVSVFAGTCVFALSILLLRRFAIGGELGGPFLLKAVSSLNLLILWVVYVALSSWFALRQGEADLNEGLVMFGSCVGVALITFAVFMCVVIKEIAYGEFHHHAGHRPDDGTPDQLQPSASADFGSTTTDDRLNLSGTKQTTVTFGDNAEAPEVPNEGMNATKANEEVDDIYSAARPASVSLEIPYDGGHTNGNGTTMEGQNDEATLADDMKVDAPSFEESQAALCRIQALRRAGEPLPQMPPLTHEMVVAESPVSPNTCCCSMKLAQ